MLNTVPSTAYSVSGTQVLTVVVIIVQTCTNTEFLRNNIEYFPLLCHLVKLKFSQQWAVQKISFDTIRQVRAVFRGVQGSCFCDAECSP